MNRNASHYDSHVYIQFSSEKLRTFEKGELISVVGCVAAGRRLARLFGRDGIWNLRLAPDCQRYGPSAKTTGHQMGLYSITFFSSYVVIDVCSQQFYG